MSTGDLNCNVGRLRSVLREMRYTYASSLPEDRLREGDPSVLLPVLHYCLLGYSSKVAAHVSSKGYELQAKTDDRFIEHLWRFLRDDFKFMPQLNKQQFLTKGFAERKLMLVTDVAKLCKQQHALMSRQEKLQAKRTPKGAHLESVFPPVARKNTDKDAAAATQSSPPPLPKTPPVVYEHKRHARGGGDGAAIAAAERHPSGAEVEEESSEYSSEYTSTYADSELGEGEDTVDDYEDEDEDEEDFPGFRQSPVDFSTLEPGFREERRPTVERNMIHHAGAVTPSKAKQFFSQVLLSEDARDDSDSDSGNGRGGQGNRDNGGGSGAAAGRQGPGLSPLLDAMKDQVRFMTTKLDTFQENVKASFILLDGRVRHLEAVLKDRGRVLREKTNTAAAGAAMADHGPSRPALASKLAPMGSPARATLTQKTQKTPLALSSETSSFIAQVEGRCKQTEILLESLVL